MAEAIQHDGVVVSIDGTKVRVKIVQADACAACRAKSMCMSSESKEKFLDCTATDEQLLQLKVGDKVMVSVTQRMGWKAVVLAYILPFVVLMSVLAVVDLWSGNEALAGLIALCAVGVYYVVLSRFKDKISRAFDFRITSIG